MERKSIFAYLIFFICFILVASATASNSKRGFHFVPKVDVYKVKVKSEIPIHLVYPARLKSFKDVKIRAQVSGVLLKRFFREGKFVKKGKILFQIDPSIYKAKLEQLKANLDAALANLNYSKENYLRIKKSFEENLVSKEKFDYAQYQYKTAKANVENLRAQIRLAEIYLSYTQPKAPISGFTRARKVDIGNLISVGQALVEIVKINPIYAIFSIPDSDIKLIEANRDHLRAFLLINKRRLPGKIDFIDIKINRNTQSLEIRAIFNNKGYKLLPNEFARVELSGIYKKRKTIIPQRAVLQTVNGAIVYLIVKNKAIPKPIKVLGEYKNYFIVKGLKEGQTIAVDNLLKLRPNMEVSVDKTVK